MKDCSQCNGTGLRYEIVGSVWRSHLCSCIDECSECDSIRTVIVEHQGYDFAVDCPICGRLWHVARHITQAQIPAQYELKHLRPKTQEQRELLNYIKHWLADFRPGVRGFTLTGPVGVGKSQVVAVLIRKLAELGYRSKWLHISMWLDGLRADLEESALIIRQCQEVPVLVLDELQPLRTEWEMQRITALLLGRYQARRTTIATMNGGEAEIRSIFGESGIRIVSRMAEWMPIITVGGPDLRRAQ